MVVNQGNDRDILTLALRSTNHRFTDHQRLPHSSFCQAFSGARSTTLSILVSVMVFVKFQIFGH